MPKLKALCQTVQAGVAQTFLCSVVDHHSASYGDKGWGCGYRNLQMLMSSLAHYRCVRKWPNPANGVRYELILCTYFIFFFFYHFSAYAERLGITKGAGVPSISRLQGLIEEA